MAFDPESRAHQEWLGLLQPVGLVVSAPALVASQAFVNRNIVAEQQALIGALASADDEPLVQSFPDLAQRFLGWEPADLAGAPGGPELPDTLAVALPEYGEILRPTYAVPDSNAEGGWLLLVQLVPASTDLDKTPSDAGRNWQASPQMRFERLLRELKVPIGILANNSSLRLIYAPKNESAGHLTFPVAPMISVAGRPIVAALHMLLSAERLFSLPIAQRLPALLKQSRKYQNDVSIALANQVLESLYELLRGFQAADEAARGELLREVLREAPADVYGGLLATLMRLVFILYAEDRGLISDDGVYGEHYSVSGLFERLREDDSRYHDTMDQRYGAWPQLLTLFRMLHDGASHGGIHLPARQGRLFDPDVYPFLEGRPHRTRRVMGERIAPPRVSDGVIFRVLEKLLVLKADRLSYRALDVEQIGSVYEAMMGFSLLVARGVSIAVGKQHEVVNLEELLHESAAERGRWLAEHSAVKLTGQGLEKLTSAASVEEVLAALGKRVSRLTPRPIPVGAMVLEPTEERRRSGSHYTPRSLTEPIVRTTLRPIFESMGAHPRPEQILDLNVCDPAMGSGAFLVETCRLLGDKLVDAWQFHGQTPAIPLDEDVHLFARRLVAQRCLYGVDRNPFAVDLAKLSLWLVTLAKGHPFTFLDHALRHGDSLVGFSRDQIASFNWEKKAQLPLVRELIDRKVLEAEGLRAEIEGLAAGDDTWEKRRLLRDADGALRDVRLIGDALAAAFFGAESKKLREARRKKIAHTVQDWLAESAPRNELEGIVADLSEGEGTVVPFHWEIEFPEVFARENPGFDAFVGNPPFAGKNSIISGNAAGYIHFLQALHSESHGASDLVAHFFRRAFSLLREGGAFGLIATNTIAQGDTRNTGLRWICQHGGTLFAARKRLKWPGMAAVVVSVVHGAKGQVSPPYLLDDRAADRITAFLFHAGGHDDPLPLAPNAGKSFQGSIVLGMGFTFDEKEEATPIQEMHRLIADFPKNAEVIFPYIGGEEVNEEPTHTHRRYVINFGEATESEARTGWPELMRIVEAKVKPQRLRQKDKFGRQYWWRFLRTRPELQAAMARVEWALAENRTELSDSLRSEERILVIARVSNALAFTFLDARVVFNEKIVAFPFANYSTFGALQSRVHGVWARFFSATLKDDLQYTPSDCFETFPFPDNWQTNERLEKIGRIYYEFRAALMVRNNQGLTAIYNRFHQPNERDPGIIRLRELHAEMDRAVLDAYGWNDFKPTCEFLLDYEEEEEESGQARRRKKPYRYRWPDELRDEVLARLLVLNRERAIAEGQVPTATELPTRAAPKRRSRMREQTGTPLFADADGK